MGETPLHPAVINCGSKEDIDGIMHISNCFGQRCPTTCLPSCGFAGRNVSIVGKLLLAGPNINAANNNDMGHLLWAIYNAKLE
jgi:hypothetical protein